MERLVEAGRARHETSTQVSQEEELCPKYNGTVTWDGGATRWRRPRGRRRGVISWRHCARGDEARALTKPGAGMTGGG